MQFGQAGRKLGHEMQYRGAPDQVVPGADIIPRQIAAPRFETRCQTSLGDVLRGDIGGFGQFKDHAVHMWKRLRQGDGDQPRATA